MNVVQIGVNQANDELTQLIRGKPLSRLILVEPLALHNDAIRACYGWDAHISVENIAITDRDDLPGLTFYYHINDAPHYQAASTSKAHILKHLQTSMGPLDEPGLREVAVPCMTISQLFAKYQLTEIDILYIDAEGMDDAIIRSIDFSRFKINMIFFEHIHLPNEQIFHYLVGHGYKIAPNVFSYTSLAHRADLGIRGL